MHGSLEERGREGEGREQRNKRAACSAAWGHQRYRQPEEVRHEILLILDESQRLPDALYSQGAILCRTGFHCLRACPLTEKLRPWNSLSGCLAQRWYCQEQPFEWSIWARGEGRTGMTPRLAYKPQVTIDEPLGSAGRCEPRRHH